jgi:carboxypeptidase C (cathepsin A)
MKNCNKTAARSHRSGHMGYYANPQSVRGGIYLVVCHLRLISCFLSLQFFFCFPF